MDESALRCLLDRLIAEWENEIVEFKSPRDSYPASDVGRYFSALANEANLRESERAWLVFGVDDKTRKVTGSTYRSDVDHLNRLKLSIAQGTEPSVTFREIHSFDHDGRRVLLFEIPAAPMGMPISWNGHYYARAGESLTALGIDKLDEMRRQASDTDWTSQTVPDAELEDLDTQAVARARTYFVQKHANRFNADEVHAWPDDVFLDRARVTIKGRMTRTALLLLGRPESAALLSPHPAQMTWRLESGETAYEHFGPPFLLSTTALYRRIRNVQIRVLPEDELVSIEVAKYDQSVVLEALHNCIAHQDYSRGGRIVVTEHMDRLTFTNLGEFVDGFPADYATGKRTPIRYRNPFLAQAMTGLNMIDTMGYGISRMYKGQAARYFPLPDYDLSRADMVEMTVHGRVLDPAYSRLLIQKTDLPLEDILALDRVQKHQPLVSAVVRRLRRAGLIEGRRPNLHVSATVAKAAATQASYIRTRAQDDAFYKQLISDYLRKFGSATRQDVDQLLREKLSEALTEDQKTTKISNLLTAMRRAGSIQNVGSRGQPKWTIAERNSQ